MVYRRTEKGKMQDMEEIKRTVYALSKADKYMVYYNNGEYKDFYNYGSFLRGLKLYPHECKIVEGYNKIFSCLMSVVQNPYYDKFYIYDEIKVDKENNKENKLQICADSDCIFDIRVHNATYAKLFYGSVTIDMEKVDDIYTIPDVTIDNPFSNDGNITTKQIVTDGDRIEYGKMYLQSRPRSIWLAGNGCLLRIKNKNLFIYTSYIHTCLIKEELEQIDNKNPKHELLNYILSIKKINDLENDVVKMILYYCVKDESII